MSKKLTNCCLRVSRIHTVQTKQILILQRSRYRDLRTNKWIIYHRHVASFANDSRVDMKQKQSIKLVRLRTVARTCLFISEIVGALYVARGGYSREYEPKGERKLSTAGGRCKLNLVAKEVITAGTCPSLLHGIYVRHGIMKKSSAGEPREPAFFFRKRGSYVIRMRKLCVHSGKPNGIRQS